MRTHARAPASSGQAIRGARLAFKRASAVKVSRRRVVTVRAEGENFFQKLGTQLVKAGTTLVSTVSGTQKVGRRGATDPNVVFVAGATGRLGSRIVKECLLAGLSVRAGVRNQDKGAALVDAVKEDLSAKDARRLQVVEFDLFDEVTIPSAIGNAGLVVCAIGADESKPFDVSAPKKVDGDAAIALVKSAARQGVAQFVMITSLGTTKFGWPASALNLFWGVLYHKKRAEQALQTSGMAYTIIRPGGMERPKDDYKETHRAVLAPRDTFFGGQVSRLQVAELTAACLTTRELSENKVLEIVAEQTQPPATYEELLEQVPQEISMAEILEKKALVDDARNKARLLAAELEEVEQELAAAEERKINAENAFSEARAELQSVTKESRDVLSAAQASERELERLSAALEDAKRQEAAARAVLDAQRRVARNLELLSPAEIKDITFPILNPGAEKPEPKAPGALFGGLFGGSKPAAKEQEVEEEEEEEEAPTPAPKRAPVFSLFGAQKAPEPEPEPEPEEPEPVPEAPKSRGGGLFGLFQQETVYADEQSGAPPVMAAQAPSQEVVERAVTKRGKRGPRKSIKELVPRKESTPEPAAAAPAAAEPAKEQAPPVANFFASLFGGSEAQESAAPEPPKPAPAAKPAPAPPAPASKAPPPPPAPKPTPAPAVPEPVKAAAKVVPEPVKSVIKAAAEAPKAPEKPKAAEPAKPVEAPKPVEAAKPAPAAPAASNQSDAEANAAEARAWIAAWRAKNKVKVTA